jgi:cytochrome c oxidase cbb3-type subunit 3
LSIDPSSPDESAAGGYNPLVALWVFLGMSGLFVAGFVAFFLIRDTPSPPPPEVLNDPLLLEGRAIYLGRCATCHGFEGRGDGPIAGQLLGPPVGNLADGQWKHGGKPDEVLGVVSRGVSGTRMAGWGQVLENDQLRAVTAYVFYLARQPVPAELRKSQEPSPG